MPSRHTYILLLSLLQARVGYMCPRPFLAIHVAAYTLYEEESYSFRSVFITNYTQDSRDIFIHVPAVFRSHSPHYPLWSSSHTH